MSAHTDATPLNPNSQDVPPPAAGPTENHVPAQVAREGTARETTAAAYEAGERAKINPWKFVPVLYFMQLIPYVIVNETFVSVYKDLKLDNITITFWTSIIALPWTFKLFWGPFVDLNFTKRGWTLAMQVLITACLALSALVMPTGWFFPLSLFALFLIAICSATHDIACDGLYLMSLDKTRQAAFSGVMATSARIGRIFALFVLLYLGGFLQRFGIAAQTAWAWALGLGAVVYGIGMLWNSYALPRPGMDVPAPQSEPNQNTRNILRTVAVVATGVALYFVIASVVEFTGLAIYRAADGVRIPPNWNMTGAEIRALAMKSGICLLLVVPFWLITRRLIGTSPMGEAFSTYFRQGGFGAILAFIVFYRFGEAMIFKMVPLFLQGTLAEGGMGLSVDEVGKIHGFGGVLGLILGGLAGGAVIAKVGLRRAFWPLVICMHTPNLLYVLVAWERPANHLWLYPVAFIEAFGYGFGFAGYFVYLMYVAQRRPEFRTSHYAIGTGLGALFITFAGILSGILQQAFGYLGFFIAACLFTIPGTLTLLFIPMDEEETKSVKAEAAGH